MTDAVERVELDIRGMTCTSCAARVEKRLNRIEGVQASVNYATEKAVVQAPSHIDATTLIETVEAAGYSAALPRPHHGGEHGGGHEHDHDLSDAETQVLRRRLLVSLGLSIPVVVLAMVPRLQFDGWQWASMVLAAPVAVWGALPFHRATWVNLKHRATTMDTLISMGVLAAFGWSLYALFFGDAGDAAMRMGFSLGVSNGHGADAVYFEVASGVTVFLLAGRYFEAKAKRSSGAALRALMELGAKDVAVLRDGVEARVPVEQLAVGERFVVRPGEKVATDGVVEDGTSAIDASLLTGESVPVEVGPGDEVAGATVNAGGRLVVRATRVGSDTALAHIARLVADAQSGKAPVQRLADRISAVFVPTVIVLAGLTLAGWLATGHGVESAFTAAVAVLIIACPCALGLATPTALLVGTGRGAQLGILIKGPEILESTRRIDTVVLDKTGTITTGRMTLVDVVVDGVTEREALRLAAAVESASEHPIGRAVVEGARGHGVGVGAGGAASGGGVGDAEAGGVDLPGVAEFFSTQGFGVRGVVEGHTVIAGRPSFVVDALSPGAGLKPVLAAAQEAAEAEGRTAVVVAWDGQARAVLAVADAVKATSAEAVTALRGLGLRPLLVTGDNRRAALAVAHGVGLDEADVVAEVRPEDKVDVVRRLQRDGRVVAMVGDGVNDAAALAQADLGVAMGTGTDVAIEASDITLVRGDLRAAADAIRLSRATLRTIKGNLFWAFAYNVAALPLAASGRLNPLIAGGAMAFSSVFVVTNSLRLRRFRSQWAP
ncbi:MAG: P-type Cu+ transporter [Acidimicrobiaceae bacterium]|nr:P-type Cu+ transporter [Acidimicrobiaceae bacterium]